MTGLITNKDGVHEDARYIKAAGKIADKAPIPRIVARRIDFDDLTAAATTENFLTFTVPAGAIILDAWFKVNTLFSGGSVSAITAALGLSGGDVDLLIEETDVFTGASTGHLFNTPTTRGTGLFDPTAGDEHPLFGYYVGTSDVEVDTTFVATGDNVENLTAGQLDVFLSIVNPDEAFIES